MLGYLASLTTPDKIFVTSAGLSTVGLANLQEQDFDDIEWDDPDPDSCEDLCEQLRGATLDATSAEVRPHILQHGVV